MATDFEFEVSLWDQIYEMLRVQAQKIQTRHYKPDIIVGVARGGLVPARILMDLLETRDFAIIQIEYYKGINQPNADSEINSGPAMEPRPWLAPMRLRTTVRCSMVVMSIM